MPRPCHSPSLALALDVDATSLSNGTKALKLLAKRSPNPRPLSESFAEGHSFLLSTGDPRCMDAPSQILNAMVLASGLEPERFTLVSASVLPEGDARRVLAAGDPRRALVGNEIVVSVSVAPDGTPEGGAGGGSLRTDLSSAAELGGYQVLATDFGVAAVCGEFRFRRLCMLDVPLYAVRGMLEEASPRVHAPLAETPSVPVIPWHPSYNLHHGTGLLTLVDVERAHDSIA